MTLRRYNLLLAILSTVAVACSDATYSPSSSAGADAPDNEGVITSRLQETGELPAVDVEAGEAIGNALAMDGDTVVVGARRQSGNPNGASVRVFERRPDIGWFQTAELTGSEAGELTEFGADVAVDGDRILIGAPLNGAADETRQPAAYVFEKDAQGDWVEAAILRPTVDALGRSFGQTVALSGDTAVAADRGARALEAYTRTADGNWSSGDTLSLTSPTGSSGDWTATAVSLDGDALLVAAVDANSDPRLALIWAFARQPDGTWSQPQNIEHHRFADDALRLDVDVAHDGDDAVVGCSVPGCPTEAYERDQQGRWRSNQRLSDLRTRPAFNLGASVAIRDGVIMAGALDSDGDGRALTFVQRADGSWSAGQSTYPEADIIDGASFSLGSFYGTSVATDGQQMMVGAPFDSMPGSRITGTVVVFDVPELAGMPNAVDDEISGVEDTDIVLDVLANDSHPDQSALRLVAIGEPEHGRIRVSPTPEGLPIYEPDEEFSGTDRLEYAVEGPDGLSDEAQVVITVTEDNDPPDTASDYASTLEGEPVVVDVLENDRDTEGDALSVAAASGASNGTVRVVGDAVEYVPDAGFFGDDGFRYTARDERGAEATGRVYVTVISGNEPPIAADDEATASPGAEVTIDVLANDTDDADDALTIVRLTPPDQGRARITDTTITYVAPVPFGAPDEFSYTVRDSLGAMARARVTVRPAGAGDPSDGAGAGESGAESVGCTAAPGGGSPWSAWWLVVLVSARLARRLTRQTCNR